MLVAGKTPEADRVFIGPRAGASRSDPGATERHGGPGSQIRDRVTHDLFADQGTPIFAGASTTPKPSSTAHLPHPEALIMRDRLSAGGCHLPPVRWRVTDRANVV